MYTCRISRSVEAYETVHVDILLINTALEVLVSKGLIGKIIKAMRSDRSYIARQLLIHIKVCVNKTMLYHATCSNNYPTINNLKVKF
jgi:hypothetical protein